jgi:hypothetical protein
MLDRKWCKVPLLATFTRYKLTSIWVRVTAHRSEKKEAIPGWNCRWTVKESGPWGAWDTQGRETTFTPPQMRTSHTANVR